MNKFFRFFVRARAQLSNLLKNTAPAFFFVANLVEFVDDHKHIRLLVASIQQKFTCTQCKVVLSAHNKNNDINFLFTGEQRCGFHTVLVKARRINQCDIDGAVVQ